MDWSKVADIVTKYCKTVKICLYVKACGDEKCLVISLKCTEILIGMPCHFIKGFFIFYIGTKIRLKIMFFEYVIMLLYLTVLCCYVAVLCYCCV